MKIRTQRVGVIALALLYQLLYLYEKSIYQSYSVREKTDKVLDSLKILACLVIANQKRKVLAFFREWHCTLNISVGEEKAGVWNYCR